MALDHETIVTTALALLREEGQAGVTFRNLTARLGVKAPAIYWRFKDKRRLLEAMAEAMLRERLADLRPYDSATPWRDWLAALLRDLRAGLLAYPDGARVVAGARPMNTPTGARLAEYALAGLETAGLELTEAATVVFTAIHYTYGQVIEEQDSGEAQELDEEAVAAFSAAYPAIGRALVAARAAGTTPDDVYEAGLRRILR